MVSLSGEATEILNEALRLNQLADEAAAQYPAAQGRTDPSSQRICLNYWEARKAAEVHGLRYGNHPDLPEAIRDNLSGASQRACYDETYLELTDLLRHKLKQL